MNIEKNKKGFTLIELLAVLVVLAIIALITVPIVIGIIKEVRERSAKVSVMEYADIIKKAYSIWLIDNPNGNFKEFDYSNVEYSGSRVNCESVDYDNGNIELNGCMVGNATEKYDYQNSRVNKRNYKEYYVGDSFTFDNEEYHVITNSDKNENYVVALKDKPLITNEIETYGVGHINMYLNGEYNKRVYDYGASKGHVGAIAYFTSETCKYDGNRNSWTYSGCTSDYERSEVKYVIDNWSDDKFQNNELKIVNNYKARLITSDEYQGIPTTEIWKYTSDYNYFTMTTTSGYHIWNVG